MTKFILATAVLISSFSLWAKKPEGGNSGGGGGVLYCPQVVGRSTYQLFDLAAYENTRPHFYSVTGGRLKNFGPASYVEILQQFSNELKSSPDAGLRNLNLDVTPLKNVELDTYISLNIEKYKFLVKFVKEKVIVAGDLGKYDKAIVPTGCEVQWAAYFDDEQSELRINSEIFERLPENEKAALFVHEYIYWLSRSRHQSYDSSETRNVVGALFSHDSRVFGGTSIIGLSKLKSVTSRAVFSDIQGANFSLDAEGLNDAQEIEVKLSSLRSVAPEEFKCNGNSDVRVSVKMCVNVSFPVAFNLCTNSLAESLVYQIKKGDSLSVNESISLKMSELKNERAKLLASVDKTYSPQNMDQRIILQVRELSHSKTPSCYFSRTSLTAVTKAAMDVQTPYSMLVTAYSRETIPLSPGERNTNMAPTEPVLVADFIILKK